MLAFPETQNGFFKFPLTHDYFTLATGKASIRIMVDNFTNYEEKKAFAEKEGCGLICLLTHAHSDHTKGLYRKKGGIAADENMPLMCTSITSEIVKLECERKKLPCPNFHIIAIDECYYIIKFSIAIIAVNANHCPGSVMFNIIGADIRSPYKVLVTGDFKYDPKLHNFTMLGRGHQYIYMDDTAYRTPANEGFVSYEHSRNEIISSLDQFFSQCEDKKSDVLIVVGVYLLGKENVLKFIMDHYQLNLICNEERKKHLSICGLNSTPYELKDCLEKPKLMDIPIHHLNGPAEEVCKNILKALVFETNFKTMIIIKASSQLQKFGLVHQQNINEVKMYFFNFKYSEHSSAEDIDNFLNNISPIQWISNNSK